MFARDHLRDDEVLKRAQFSPAKAIDDVVLQDWMQQFEAAHSSSSISSTSSAPIATRSDMFNSRSVMVS